MEEPSNSSSRRGAIGKQRTGWRKVRYIFYSLLALLGAWLFLMLIMVAAAGWYTSRPVFCNSCHIMEPYYKSWQKSKHHDVTCVECHFPPGIGGKVRGKMLGLVQLIKYVTASAGPRPSAEIPDASCLRSGCHETRLLSGKVDFHGIPFDHTPHLQENRRGKTLRCTSCHSQIVQGSHMTVTTSTCFLCHFKGEPLNAGLSACTHCHQIPTKSFDLGGGVKFTHELAFTKGVGCANCHGDLVRGDGHVPRERCLSCHSREGDLAKFDDHVFMHQKHVTEHKVDCVQCHTPIEHSLQRNKIEQAVNDCQTCHPNHHQEQVNLLRGAGAKTVPAEPNVMLGVRAECRTCHRVDGVDARGDKLVRGSLQMCSLCHDAVTVQKFENEHIALHNDLPLLEKALSEVEAAAKKGGLPADRAEKIAAETAALRHDLDLLRRGNDVHNMPFATDLQRAALERITALCKELKIPPPKLSLHTNPKR
jgi:nitrate/TMAO reductase-like tetraheme cytochrome c subunit